MSRIPEKVVAQMVEEASIKMNDPSYAQTMVGSWVQAQPAATKYMTAHVKELGGAEAVVNMVFHAQLLASCFLRHTGRSVRKMTFAELDAVSDGDRDADLRRKQPALFDYLQANVENGEMRKVLTLIALGMDYVF
jgi:dihydroxyacid dehydratase/phosphogluconate dehydratase